MGAVRIEGNTRVNELREKMLTPPEICLERGYRVTESYKETESEPAVIRRAKALRKVLEKMTVHIEDEELIVGRATSKQRAAPLVPETYAGWLEEMDTLSTREWDRFSPFTEEEKAKMKEFLPYWKGKTLHEKWLALVPEDARRLIHKIQEHVSENGGPSGGHIAVDFERVLTEGLNGIKKQVDRELVKLNLAEVKDFQKYQFLKAVNITLEAAIRFPKRYAELARNLFCIQDEVQSRCIER